MHKYVFYNYFPLISDHIADLRNSHVIAHHNFAPFIIDNIKHGDTVFVKTDLLPEFFNSIFPKIKNKFFLINGSSDNEIDNKYLNFVNDDKIIKWFGFNITIEHDKIFKIPIGFEENELLGGNQILLDKLFSIQMEFKDKTNKLLITNFGNTHSSRTNLNKLFNTNNDFIVHYKERLPFEQFMQKINQYKFVLSPRGNGVDTHRFWEILLMGSVPVVETSGLDSLYNKFPCIIVESFDKINADLLNSYIHDNEKQKNIEQYLIIDNLKKIIDFAKYNIHTQLV